VRGPRTRRHCYFHPPDDRAAFALMVLIAVLGLIAFGIGVKCMIGSAEIQRRDVILAGIGLLAATVGLYQTKQVRRWNWICAEPQVHAIRDMR